MEERESINSRATNTQELDAILKKLVSEESWQKGLAFQPRATDIIISPFAKCGTTWLQQITHGLRTRGSMDFDEITAVTPWIELAHDIGWDLNSPQPAEPRIYKSHSSWYDIPKGGRYICSFRNASEAIVSFYRFYEGWLIEPRTIDIETFFNWRWPYEKVATKGYWYHMASWWEQRNNENVLLLCYEHMKTDLPGTIRKIADFMNIPLDDELLNIVTHQSSQQFMFTHKNQFDEKYIRRLSEKRAGLPNNGDSYKVTLGDSKNHYQLPTILHHQLDKIWQEQMGKKFDLTDYTAFSEALFDLNNSRFRHLST